MTKRTISIFCLSLCAMLGAASAAEPGWTTLFDGKSLDGWRASETKSTFKLVDGALVAHGTRSHLFYVGDVNGGSFENFELKVDVMTPELCTDSLCECGCVRSGLAVVVRW